jgi:hypothetical protein
MTDNSNFIAVSSVAGKISARKLTSKMRRKAYDTGWPTSISRKLTVKYTGGSFYVDFPEEILEDILDQEYGKGDSSPKPAIRTTMNNLNDHDHINELDIVLGSFLNGLIR